MMKHDGTDVRLYVLYDTATGIEAQTIKLSDREADERNRTYQDGNEPFRWLLASEETQKAKSRE